MRHVLFTLPGVWVESIISVKLAYVGIYVAEKHARWRLMWLTVLLTLQHFSCFSNIRAEHCKIIDYIEKWFIWKLCRIQFPAKTSQEGYFYLPQKWSRGSKHLPYNGIVGSFRAEGFQNYHSIKKFFKQKLYEIKFPTKDSMGACLYLPQERS